MEYMTIREASIKWKTSIRQICSWCNQGKLQGTFKKQIWFIPKAAEKALAMGYKSHKTTTCGLHVHGNRSTLTNNSAGA